MRSNLLTPVLRTLSWRGRLGRLRFVAGMLVALALSTVANALMAYVGQAALPLAFFVLLLSVDLLVVLPIKRLRDVGFKARHSLPAYVISTVVCASVDERHHLPHHASTQVFQLTLVVVLALWPGRNREDTLPKVANDP